MKLILPLPPNRANAREHWRVTQKNKERYYETAEVAIMTQCRSNVPPVRWTLTATLYVWAKMDLDNLVARLKFPLDCLVRTGVLVDDNEKWLDLQMPKQVVDRKNPRVEITLTPCDGKPKERE